MVSCTPRRGAAPRDHHTTEAGPQHTMSPEARPARPLPPHRRRHPQSKPPVPGGAFTWLRGECRCGLAALRCLAARHVGYYITGRHHAHPARLHLCPMEGADGRLQLLVQVLGAGRRRHGGGIRTYVACRWLEFKHSVLASCARSLCRARVDSSVLHMQACGRRFHAHALAADLCAADEAHRRQAVSVCVQRLHRSLDQQRVVAEAQVVVGACICRQQHPMVQ